ncbi:PREDICTED: intracellular protein transport protein USO1 [Atta cephalotes]|uniref:Lebercilin domain-containing protein n=1 Tax=Atta cephalotes TaxID=12957 RepID=A0A158NTF4_ATTCE|nr:PREDICTED: intracellular protein transport protein USO1 [Atta cephalotes]
MKQQSLSDESKSGNKSILGQRVMSAKMLRFKQLQNQLADAHYHLNELANENRLLKALQKRQDSALRRYEGANAELPRLINSHHEELRVLQTKYKKLKELHKDTCNLLKERENELYSANSQNKHLLQLSKDRNLEEREKLQLQLTDMNYKMQQQQETIQLLHRKLTLETKSLKHQLHIEISKHKETQKNLQETIEKLKSLECLLDNREKRLYYNGQLPIYNKEKNLGSHSLTNLSISNPIKSSNRSKRSENGSKDNLPSLDILESNDDEKVTQPKNVNHNQSVDQLKSETMKELRAEFDYSSDDGESGNACEYYNQSYDTPQKSRELYVRLINSTDDTLDDIMKKVDSNEEEEEKKNDLYDSGSENDVDSEGKINMNRDSPIEYKSNDFQTSLSKFAKEQFSKSFNSVTHLEHNALDIAKQSIGRLKDAQLPRISNNISDDTSLENVKVPQQSSNLNRTWLDKGQLLESNGIDDSSTDMKKEDYNAYEEMKNLSILERKKIEKDSWEAYEKESTLNHLDGSIRPVHNLEKEYFKLKDETFSIIHRSNEETLDKPGANIETQNKLNTTLNVDVSQIEQTNGVKSEIVQVKQTNEKKRTINYNKEKLLATMKAIDDNENIEFLSQGFKDHNVNRMQIMENLHRGLPAHSKPKRDIIRDIFEDNPIESKVRSTCSKSH